LRGRGVYNRSGSVSGGGVVEGVVVVVTVAVVLVVRCRASVHAL